jgi:hypothetical protein
MTGARGSMNKIILRTTNQIKDARALGGDNTVPFVRRCAETGGIGYAACDCLHSLETTAVRTKFEQKVDT